MCSKSCKPLGWINLSTLFSMNLSHSRPFLYLVHIRSNQIMTSPVVMFLYIAISVYLLPVSYITFALTCFSLFFFTGLPCWTVPLKRMCEPSLAEKKNSRATVPTPEKTKLKQYSIPNLCQDFLPLQTLLQKLHCIPCSQSDPLIDNVGEEVNRKSHAHFKPLRNTGQKKNKINQPLPSGKEQPSRDWSSIFSF